MFNLTPNEIVVAGAIAVFLCLTFVWYLIGLWGVKYNQITQKGTVIENSEAEVSRFLEQGGEPTEYTKCCINNLRKLKPESTALKNAEYHLTNS